MWTVKHIMEADFGCEERTENEPLMVLVTLESDDGRMLQLEAEDSWLTEQGIDEGDEWPDDVDAIEEETDKALGMAAFVSGNRLQALKRLLYLWWNRVCKI